MLFSSDLQVRKWMPKDNITRIRCGSNLYVQGFRTGQKMFQLRLDCDSKITWADVAEYPAISLSMANEIARMAVKLLKKRACTAESLAFGLSKCRNAEDLEIQFLNIEIGLQKTREMPTFDDVYRTWYSIQKKQTGGQARQANVDLSSYTKCILNNILVFCQSLKYGAH